MKNPKKIHSIPGYFNIEKYDEMERLSPLEWMFQLESRYMLYAAINGVLDSSHSLSIEEKTVFFNLIIRDYFNNPFKLNRSYDFFSKEHNENVEITIYIEYEELPRIVTDGAVKAMTARDFYMNHHYYNHLYMESNDENLFINKIVEYEDSLSAVKKTPIYIDLSHSDDTLKKEFERVLSELRVKMNAIKPVKAIQNYDLARWSSYKLLAYIDLELWHRINCVKSSWSSINRALHPNHQKFGDCTFRKTVAPIVERLFNSHGIAVDDCDSPSRLFDELITLHKLNMEKN